MPVVYLWMKMEDQSTFGVDTKGKIDVENAKQYIQDPRTKNTEKLEYRLAQTK